MLLKKSKVGILYWKHSLVGPGTRSILQNSDNGLCVKHDFFHSYPDIASPGRSSKQNYVLMK